MILGVVIAAKHSPFNCTLWILILLACFFVHLNTNLSNDYFEFSSGADEGDSLGGTKVIQRGLISLNEMRAAIIVLYSLAFILGLIIIMISHVWWLLAFMAFAGFSSLFYTAGPIRYGYHGLGELFVALNMGPIMVSGTVAALTGKLVTDSLWLSIPVGIMVALILFYQSIPDIDTDKKAGKYTLAVKLDSKRVLIVFRIFVISSVISIVILCLLKMLNPLAYLSPLSLIPAFKADSLIRKEPDKTLLHSKGNWIRFFYLSNGILIILAKYFL